MCIYRKDRAIERVDVNIERRRVSVLPLDGVIARGELKHKQMCAGTPGSNGLRQAKQRMGGNS